MEGAEPGHSAAPVVVEGEQQNIQELASEQSAGCQEVEAPPSSSEQEE